MSGRDVVLRPPGRPKGSGVIYTEEIGLDICTRIAAGETLQDIIRNHWADTFSVWTVNSWLVAYPEFSKNYARARQIQLATWADEAVRIADTPVMGEEIDAVEIIDEEAGGVDHKGNPLPPKTRTRREVRRSRKDMLGHRNLQVQARLRLYATVSFAEKLRLETEAKRLEAAQGLGDDGTTRVVVQGGLPDD